MKHTLRKTTGKILMSLAIKLIGSPTIKADSGTQLKEHPLSFGMITFAPKPRPSLYEGQTANIPSTQLVILLTTSCLLSFICGALSYLVWRAL